LCSAAMVLTKKLLSHFCADSGLLIKAIKMNVNICFNSW
jgi:hypothetical protein